MITIHASDTMTGLVYHPDYLKHDPGPGHPERPERLTAIRDHLEKQALLKKLVLINPEPAALEWVERVHTSTHIHFVRDVAGRGGGLLDFGDTPVSRESYRAGLLAVGGVIGAIDAVLGGKVHNVFCALRPPGHHAERDRAMGFCLFNNIAIGARYVQQHYGLKKVFIVDWDLHHGNGTQHIFYQDPTVFYFSLHQFPYYPGTGAASETGKGEGEGFTFNVPMLAGQGDEEYLGILRKDFRQLVEKFKPDFILISAGFDAHRDDPLGGINLSTNGFREITRIVKEAAGQLCQGRLVSTLEGGYNLTALAESVAAHVGELHQTV